MDPAPFSYLGTNQPAAGLAEAAVDAAGLAEAAVDAAGLAEALAPAAAGLAEAAVDAAGFAAAEAEAAGLAAAEAEAAGAAVDGLAATDGAALDGAGVVPPQAARERAKMTGANARAFRFTGFRVICKHVLLRVVPWVPDAVRLLYSRFYPFVPATTILGSDLVTPRRPYLLSRPGSGTVI
jgi:hypothetical protein